MTPDHFPNSSFFSIYYVIQFQIHPIEQNDTFQENGRNFQSKFPPDHNKLPIFFAQLKLLHKKHLIIANIHHFCQFFSFQIFHQEEIIINSRFSPHS